MAMEIGGQVEKINGKELSYSEFVQSFMEKNKPVVLTGLMDDWRACSDWVADDGKPNFPFFASNFGKSKVQVADCGTREFTDQKREEMSVSEFVDKWVKKSGLCNGDKSSNKVVGDNSVLYLKDWHFVKGRAVIHQYIYSQMLGLEFSFDKAELIDEYYEEKEDIRERIQHSCSEYPEYKAYTTPVFFSDDWLNMYLDSFRMHEDPDGNLQNDEISCSDYHFVYMGEKGSWTPLHADVFRSYSWSANVCGKKRWLLLSPSQRKYIFDKNMKNCVYNIFDDVSGTKFPRFKEATWLECIQEQNEIIFVPSGWYHQVHNLEDTISINHNWFNRHNLEWVWDLLLNDYNEAKEYIEDIKDICDDFEGLCQRNLAANAGMNFYDFFIFLARMSLANVVQLSYLLNEFPNIIYNQFPISSHLDSNCSCIRDIAFRMKGLTKTNREFHLDLKETLDDPRFLKLNTVLEQTMAHQFQFNECYFSKGSLSLDDRALFVLRNQSSRVSTPEDLGTLIKSVLVSHLSEPIF